MRQYEKSGNVVPFPSVRTTLRVAVRDRPCRMVLDPSEPESAFDPSIMSVLDMTGQTFWLEIEQRCADEADAMVQIGDGPPVCLNGLVWPLRGCEIVVGRVALRGGFLRRLLADGVHALDELSGLRSGGHDIAISQCDLRLGQEVFRPG